MLMFANSFHKRQISFSVYKFVFKKKKKKKNLHALTMMFWRFFKIRDNIYNIPWNLW